MFGNMDIYWQDHVAKVSKYIKDTALDMGEILDQYMDTISPKRKYVCEVLMAVPLAFIAHQWLLLSPYSEYRIFEPFLFVLRYIVAFILISSWVLNTGLRFQVCTYLFLDIAIAWVRHISYWSYQDEAYETCHEKSILVWSDVTDNWWLPATVSFIIQFVYISHRPGTILWREKGIDSLLYLAPLLSLIPDVIALIGLFPAFMSELSYWIQSILFSVICLIEIGQSVPIDNEIDRKKINSMRMKLYACENEATKRSYRDQIQALEAKIVKRDQGTNFVDRVPGKWFARDTIFVFMVAFVVIAVVSELLIYKTDLTSLMSLGTLIKMLASWCSTLITILGVSGLLGLLSNIGVALSHLLLDRQILILEAFDANVGSTVNIYALLMFLEANFQSLEYYEKAEAMKFVILFTMYAIVSQILDVLKRNVLLAVNSGVSRGIFYHLRVGLLTGLLLTIPTLLTFSASQNLNISFWIMFFATGNSTLLVRTICMLVESTLIKLSWTSTDYSSTFESIIHYIHLTEGLVIAMLHAVQCYMRYTSQFLKGWWLFRLCMSAFSLFIVVAGIGVLEYNRYQSRNRMKNIFNNLPIVNVSDVSGEHNGMNENECAICYSVMTRAKKLPCNHYFHQDCLKRWFQVKTVCPFCNTNIIDGSKTTTTNAT